MRADSAVRPVTGLKAEPATYTDAKCASGTYMSSGNTLQSVRPLTTSGRRKRSFRTMLATNR